VATPGAEVHIDAALVRSLLAEQHPDLAALALTHVASGWDNEIFRLGEDRTVRLPRRWASAFLTLHEQRWLPELAVGLPLPVPVPERIGQPSEALGYPWPWTVGPWFPGRPAEVDPPSDLDAAATTLGAFFAALHRPAPADAPENPYRAVPLPDRTERLLAGLDDLGDEVDRAAVLDLWGTLVVAPAWSGPPLWLHGDAHPLNLLVNEGRLSAVIDFGDLTAGDPASDLSVAWMLFPPLQRRSFRRAAGAVDDDTWARARGWAVALGVALAGGDDRVAAIGRRTLAAALAAG
jgi:aminoglycoside phosphotransferase (APT) family kinase protein